MKKTEDENDNGEQYPLSSMDTMDLVKEIVRRSESKEVKDSFTNLIGALLTTFSQLCEEDFKTPFENGVIAPVAVATTDEDRDVQFFVGVEVDKEKFMQMEE